jgi:predicted helicase
MYARFFRWASDRVDENGIVAFVSNSSFIDSRTYDGFRKTVAEDFNDIYIVDLGGDVRADPRLSGTKHNVFGIQTGVAISFMVKRAKAKGCRIRYARRPQLETADEKLAFLGSTKLDRISFEEISPDQRHTWINQTDNDFDQLVPIVDKKTKSLNSFGQERAIFKHFTLGVVTNRDDWVYGHDNSDVARKVKHLIEVYHADLARVGREMKNKGRVEDTIDYSIKWTRLVKSLLKKGVKLKFDDARMIQCFYRPYCKLTLYFSKQLNEMQYRLDEFFGESGQRSVPTIIWSDPTSQKPFMCAVVNGVYDLHFVGAASGAIGVAATTVAKDGQTAENITDWATREFRTHYEKGKKAKRSITKQAIFHYVYAVLNDPIYRERYAQNLKREFPRIPFYADFWRWADWGAKLMTVHLEYESAEPWPLKRIDVPDDKSTKAGLEPRAMLRPNKEAGNILLDTTTQLAGIPGEAWNYKLGNRSALEWVLDQYREKSPKDSTIREKFNTYRFLDHKETVIDLAQRITRVSVETMKVLDAMRQEHR